MSDQPTTIRVPEAHNKEWYSIRSLLGNDWAIFYFSLGGREVGKSYATTDFFAGQFKKYGRPFYWLRLTDASASKLLNNNAEKLIDPDIRRKYGLDLVTRGSNVYHVTKRDKDGKPVEKKLMARVLALSTFYNDKGSGLFDKDFLDDPNMYYNIALDEMNKEQGERRITGGDIVYAFVNQLENLVRSTKKRIRVICIGNCLEEASDILAAFNFLPERFGRFKLKSKRAVIDYIAPSDKYLERRKGTIADIVMPEASTFTNQIESDTELLTQERLIKPSYVIQFTKKIKYTVWNENVIHPYNGEKVRVVAMVPYQDAFYNQDLRNQIIELYDTRAFRFRTLITQKKFKHDLEIFRPRK